MAAFVYLATNRINGKRYVGVTGKTLDRRRSQHEWEASHGKLKCRYFHFALQKYGFSNFEWRVLLHCHDYADGLQEEIRLISEIKPEYNLTDGGQGGLGRKISDEARAKMSLRRKGIELSAETVAKIAAKNRGKKRSPEHCQRMSDIRLELAASGEIGAKISAAKKGKKFTDAHRAALSVAHKGKPMSAAARANLKTHFVKGMKMDPEVVVRREAARQRTLEARRHGSV
jgi:group I intron endonuclease